MAEAGAHDARGSILARVRAALPRVRPQPLPAMEVPSARAPLGLESEAACQQRFTEELERVGGHVHVAIDEAAAARALALIASQLDARELALSDDPLVRRLAETLPPERHRFDSWSDRERLFACDLGLSGCQAAVAETGTLLLDSSAERHRLVSLVPPVHVAVLRRSVLLPGLGEALALAGRGRGDLPAGAVTLITGPSRTADIELELVIGVHGPRALHVIILEEDPA